MSLALANIFVCNCEDIWPRNCLLECKPSYYKRYADNIFVFLESEIQVELFKIFINTRHRKMKLTFVNKQNKYFNFLDVKFVRENNIFTTSIYHWCRVKNNSQTPTVHDHMLFVRQLFVLQIFQFLLKVHVTSNLRFRKVV